MSDRASLLPGTTRKSTGRYRADIALHGHYDHFVDLLKDPVFHRDLESKGWRLAAWRWALGDTRRLSAANSGGQEARAATKVADAEGGRVRLFAGYRDVQGRY